MEFKESKYRKDDDRLQCMLKTAGKLRHVAVSKLKYECLRRMSVIQLNCDEALEVLCSRLSYAS